MKRKKKKAIVLLSGGLDSTTIAYYAKKKEKREIYTLAFDYGQRHKKELNCAKNISKVLKAKAHKVIKFDLKQWGGSSLTDSKLKVPEKTSRKIPNTYVPARNTIFLSFGLSFAEAVNADEIFIGVNAVDYSGYVDCRPEYINKFQELANLATVSGVYKKKIKVKTPLIDLTKAEIIKLGDKLGVDWSKTWSCYKGNKLACGKCDSCRLRLKGFKDAGSIDTLIYK